MEVPVWRALKEGLIGHLDHLEVYVPNVLLPRLPNGQMGSLAVSPRDPKILRGGGSVQAFSRHRCLLLTSYSCRGRGWGTMSGG